MLFYFTGTGNSLYVARQIEEKPISIPQILHQENLNFKDEKIGIVYPVYAGEAPKIVLEFLEKATFETDYFYLILTYGKDVTDAPECIARLLEEKGRHVNYIHSILMVDNYLPSFDMNEQRAMNKNVEQQIQQALQDIQNKKQEIPEATQAGRDFHASAKEIFAKNPELINGEQITVTDKCVGCGRCYISCYDGGHQAMEWSEKTRTPHCNTEKCVGCLLCGHVCPVGCIDLGEVKFKKGEKEHPVTL